MGAIGDYFLILLSSIKENRKIKAGAEKNKNLPENTLRAISNKKRLADNGDVNAAYQLGTKYLNGDDVGYDPKLGEKYLKIAAQKDDFDANYALALFYRGYWSYMHHDGHMSYMHYLHAKECKTNSLEYMAEVKRAIEEDYEILNNKGEICIYLKDSKTKIK